jgi:hypothetical protein
MMRIYKSKDADKNGFLKTIDKKSGFIRVFAIANPLNPRPFRKALDRITPIRMIF